MMKQVVKKILALTGVQFFLGFLLSLYVRLVFYTNRWTVIGQENIEPFWKNSKPLIACFWHGRLMMMVYGWRSKRPFVMLQTNHRDGRLMNCFLRQFGLGGVLHKRGDAGKARGFLDLAKALQAGCAVGLTPDGPKGPRYKMKKGVAALALTAMCDVVPTAFSLSRHVRAKSWDRFMVGLPFGRGVFVYGKPVSPDAFKKDVGSFQKVLEKALIDVTKEADQHCGIQSDF